MNKRILSILMVTIMAFAVATTACGKKEDETTAQEETKVEAPTEDDKQQEESNTAESDVAEEGEEPVNDGEMKTGADTLTEEEIQELKTSIKDAVVSEYLKPNNISPEEFSWSEIVTDDWTLFNMLVEEYIPTIELGMGMFSHEADTQSQKIVMAVFKGVTNWLEGQGKFDSEYLYNVVSTLQPYDQVIPTIDITVE